MKQVGRGDADSKGIGTRHGTGTHAGTDTKWRGACKRQWSPSILRLGLDGTRLWGNPGLRSIGLSPKVAAAKASEILYRGKHHESVSQSVSESN